MQALRATMYRSVILPLELGSIRKIVVPDYLSAGQSYRRILWLL